MYHKKRPERRPVKIEGTKPVMQADFNSYFDAIYLVYQEIIEKKPDLLVVPLRGAEPILRAIQLFASLEKNSSKLPRVCYLRIGQVDRDKSPHPFSYSTDDKIAETRKRLDHSIKSIGASQPKVMLLDEVSHGGSISKNYSMVRTALRRVSDRFDLHAVAVSEIGQERSAKFNALVVEGKLKPFFVRKLFTMDRNAFLMGLIRESATLTRVTNGPLSSRMSLLRQIERRHETLKKRIQSGRNGKPLRPH